MACCLTRQANDDQCDRRAGVQEAELKLSSWGHGRNGGSDSTKGGRNSTEKVERTIAKSVTSQPKNASLDALLRDAAAGRPLVPGVDIQGGLLWWLKERSRRATPSDQQEAPTWG